MAGDDKRRDDGSGLDLLDRDDTRTERKVERPRMYKVLLHNDDYTMPDFVVKVLRVVFKMGGERAFQVMLAAHQTGRSVVCVYTRDVAETKVTEAMDMAKVEGAPLMFTAEPEE